MAWDIYGNTLTRGHCEVHPQVAQEYPCYICMEESRKADEQRRQEREQRKAYERDYEQHLKMEAMPDRIFTITENGFSMDGSGKVSVPACRIKAKTYAEAANKLTAFLETRELTEDIELITPLDKIDFE